MNTGEKMRKNLNDASAPITTKISERAESITTSDLGLSKELRGENVDNPEDFHEFFALQFAHRFDINFDIK